MNTITTVAAPPGLKGLVVAQTEIGSVRGTEGFFHYRQYDATELASLRSFEAIACLLLNTELPTPYEEDLFRVQLATARQLPEHLSRLAERLAAAKLSPMAALRSLLAAGLDATPSLDQSVEQRRATVIQAIGMAPTLLAAVHRLHHGRLPVPPDGTNSHASDWLSMLTDSPPNPQLARAVETYLCLTADHGFNASTFTARVVASTGADIGGALSSALAALSGPLHGGAPSRVLDMLEAIGDPAATERWAVDALRNGHKIMGFGHAVYRGADPRSELLRTAAMAIGGELVERALEIERRMLAVLQEWKPQASIATNVEYYAAILLHLAAIPQSMFTSTFAISRIVGWSAHILEQTADNKIMRPSSRYVGPAPPVPVPRGNDPIEAEDLQHSSNLPDRT